MAVVVNSEVVPKSGPEGVVPMAAQPVAEAVSTGSAVSPLVAPFSWFFSRSGSAKVFAWLFAGGLWLLLLLARWNLFPLEPVYWAHECILVLSFTFATCTSVWLLDLFATLRQDLSGAHEQVRLLLEQQYQDLRGWGQLIVMPVLVGGLAISIRYVCSSDIFEPFTNRTLDYLFSFWLFVGFCCFMHAMVPVARFSRIVRILGEVAEDGRLGRSEIRKVSGFYLKTAVLSTLMFFLGGMVIFVLHLIYTYHGNPWPGLYVFSGIKAQSLWGFLTAVYRHDSSLEILVAVLLYGGISLGSLIYFLVPQWNVHELLVHRKQRSLERAEQALEEAEKQMMAAPGAESMERYTRQTMMVQAVENMPEWPFDGRGFVGFLLVMLLPALIVIFKEIILETIVGFLTR